MELQGMTSQPTVGVFSYPVDVWVDCGYVTCEITLPVGKHPLIKTKRYLYNIARSYIPNFNFYQQYCREIKFRGNIIYFKYSGSSYGENQQDVVQKGDNIFFKYDHKGFFSPGTFIFRQGKLYYPSRESDFVTAAKLLFAPVSIVLNELSCSAPLKLKLRSLICIFIVPGIAFVGLLLYPLSTKYCIFLISDLDCWVNGFDKDTLSKSSCETRSSERSFVPMHLRPYLLVNIKKVWEKNLIMLQKGQGVPDFALNALFRICVEKFGVDYDQFLPRK